MTVGPWRMVNLHTYRTRISDLDIRSKVTESFERNLTVNCTLSNETTAFASVVLKSPDGRNLLEERGLVVVSGHIQRAFYFPPGTIDLWYPVGCGKQPIYTVDFKVTDQVIGSMVKSVRMYTDVVI
jgi:beta-mannosidase